MEIIETGNVIIKLNLQISQVMIQNIMGMNILFTSLKYFAKQNQ